MTEASHASEADPEPPTPFHDLRQYVAIPRITDLALSPTGDRLVATVSALSAKGDRWLTSLWEIDPGGGQPARRLTRSAKGEGSPAFLPSGDLLFVSGRPDPDAEPDGPPTDEASLWLLPPVGEARQVLSRRGGVSGMVTARAATSVVVTADVLAAGHDGDADQREARKEAGVTAVLHEQAIVRYWDHDLGPGSPHLLVTAAPPPDGTCPPLRDLTPGAGHGLLDTTACLTPDGRTVVTSWFEPDGQGYGRMSLLAIDVESGGRTVVAADDDHDYDHPVVSPDGTWVACLRHRRPQPTRSPAVRPWLVRLDGSGGHDPCPDLVQWPASITWAPDAGALFVTADEGGQTPVFRVDLPAGEVTRLTGRGAHADLQVSPDGQSVYALWSPVDRPPAVVRYDARSADQLPDVLSGPPGADPPVPGSLTEVTATGADGFPLRAWLCLPDRAPAGAPAPLMVWVHGGPLGSWSSWHWRWNPWVAVAQGYAVLLPDPAFSTGYGQEMVDRGWGQWGGNPYTDVLALTDAALERDDLDTDRTCLLGGSYGGYLANWVAGHTDRFRCIVTHASLWALDQFGPTTDLPGYWKIEMGDEGTRAWTPHVHADAIATPMLVIHGDRDYRVPIGEALRLWDDLTRRGVPAKFLYFPTEGHWIQSPGNARVWYETVLAFCDEHVRGKPWRRPALL